MKRPLMTKFCSACLSAFLCAVAHGESYFLANGSSDTILENKTYDSMFVQGDLTIASGVTVNAGTFLMASNVTARLTIGESAKLNVTSASSSDGSGALFGTYGGRAYVTLESSSRVYVSATGDNKGSACIGYCTDSSTPAYGFVTVGTNAIWSAKYRTFFNRGSSISMSGYTADTVLSTVTLLKGSKITGNVIRNGANALLIRFAGGMLENVELSSNQTGQIILESVEGADIALRKSGGTIFTTGAECNASFTLRGTGNVVKTGSNPPLYDFTDSTSTCTFNWQLDGDLKINEGGLRITRDVDIGSSRIVCAAGTELSVEATLRTGGVNSGEYGTFVLTNRTDSANGRLVLCGSGDLSAPAQGVKVQVEGGAHVRVAGISGSGYPFYRFLVTDGDGASRNCIQLSEFALMNGDMDVTRIAGVTYKSGDPSTEAAKKYTNAFDGDTSTKWIAEKGTAALISQSNVWLQVSYPAPQPITGYRWATADDKPRENEEHSDNCRDPKAWTLFGSSDGVNWIVLDEVANYPFHKSRCAFTGDTFVPDFEDMPVLSPRMEVKDGGTLSFVGASIMTNIELVAESASISGTLHVASGQVTCRSAHIGRWSSKYWRLSISKLKNRTTKAQLSEFALYDKDGNRVNSGLVSGGNAVAPSSLAAGRFTSFFGAEALECFTNYGMENLFDDDTATKMCANADLATGSSVVIIMRLADDAAPVTGYLFASAPENEDRDPSDWTLEASADGVIWNVVDTQTDVVAGPGRSAYNAYNGGVPYGCSAYEPLNGAVLALGTTLEVDTGSSISFAPAPTPISSLVVDGAGAGTIDVFDIAANGTLYLTGVTRDALSDYTVPLTIGSFANGMNARTWKVLLDDKPMRVRMYAKGGHLKVCGMGIIVNFR